MLLDVPPREFLAQKIRLCRPPSDNSHNTKALPVVKSHKALIFYDLFVYLEFFFPRVTSYKKEWSCKLREWGSVDWKLGVIVHF